MNEDVFPIEHWGFPASHVSELRGVSVRYKIVLFEKVCNKILTQRIHVWYIYLHLIDVLR